MGRGGERVGLALKGVDSEDLNRGFVLITDDSLITSDELDLNAEIISFWASPLREEMVLHIGHWMQFTPCRVESVDFDNDWRLCSLHLSLEKPLVHPRESRVALTHLDGGKLRVVGIAEIT